MTKIILITIGLAAAPVAELRGAIPYALTHGLSWQMTLLWSIIGNIIPIVFILWFLDPLAKWLSKHFKIFEKFFYWLFEHTRKKHAKKIEAYEELALIVLTALPIPILGGAWTAALVAFIFGLKYKKALPSIFIGVILGASIILILSLGIIDITKK